MTTTSIPGLTPKQRQVLDLLHKEVAPPEIAKRLKISPSGVYGHMRNLRALGVILPGENSTGAPAGADPPPFAPVTLPSSSASSSNANGTPDPETALRGALDVGEQRVSAIEGEVAELHRQIEALEAERAEIDSRVAKYKTALEALA